MSMNVVIKKMPEIKFTGISLKTNNPAEMPEKCPQLWMDFMPREKEIKNVKEDIALGVCRTHRTDDQMTFEYYAALPVTEHEETPEGMKSESLPACEYAVFEHKGSLENLGNTYNFIYEEWLKNSEYQLVAMYDFEYYDEKFNHKDMNDPESKMYIYIPVKKKIELTGKRKRERFHHS